MSDQKVEGGDSLDLSVSAVERRTAHYPDEIRDSVRWMAGFAQRRCSGQPSLLSAIARRLDAPVDPSNLSKIFRGRWNTDSDNRLLDAPIISESKMRILFEKLRLEDRRMDFAGVNNHIETPTFKDINNYITVRQTPGRICRVGLIVGPTGSQKSESCKELVRRDAARTMFHVECPERGNMGELTSETALAVGKTPQGSMNQKKREIRDCVSAITTLIFDNAQNLYREKDKDDQRGFNWLRKLQDDTGCTLILAITMDFMVNLRERLTRGYLEQFVGRCGGADEFLVLPEFADTAEVAAIANGFKLTCNNTDLDYLTLLAQQSGRIRVLFQVLQSAQKLASKRSEKLAMVHVRSAAKNRTAEELMKSSIKPQQQDI